MKNYIVETTEENKEVTYDWKELCECLSEFMDDGHYAKTEHFKCFTLQPSIGDTRSAFRIEKANVDNERDKKVIAYVSASRNGEYIINAQGEISEQDMFALVKAVEGATDKECYPISGSEPWSWKGILSDEHIEQRSKIISAINEIKEAMPEGVVGDKGLFREGYVALDANSPFQFRCDTVEVNGKATYFDYSLAHSSPSTVEFMMCEQWCKDENQAHEVSIDKYDLLENLNGHISELLAGDFETEPKKIKEKSVER